MNASRGIRVPLAVDAQLRVPLGPVALPVRSVVTAAAGAPVAWLLLATPLPGLWGIGGALFVLGVGAVLGVPEREGVWVGTFAAYRLARRVLPSVITGGRVVTQRVERLGDAVVASDAGARRWQARIARRVMPAATGVARVAAVDSGVVRTVSGTHAAALVLDGPAVSPDSDEYAAWCEGVTGWLGALECHARVVTRITRHDVQRATTAFDDRVREWPATQLRAFERELMVELSSRTLSMRHLVVLLPLSAGADGVPRGSVAWRRALPVAGADVAERVLGHALRTAAAFGVCARAADPEDVSAVELAATGMCREAAAGAAVMECAGRHVVTVTVTALPAVIDSGAVVVALLAARVRGTAVLDIVPVATATAQRHLQRRVAALRHAARRGADQVEAAVALQDAVDAVASLASRELQPVRAALTVTVTEPSEADADAAAERLGAAFAGRGLRSTRVTRPGLLPLMATSCVGTPLRRSLVLTTAPVAARMLPCLGTPFASPAAPMLGVNRVTGAPVHHSVWAASNHNMVVVGSSGAGKSVSTKTMLVRHILGGTAAAVLDPDSEYLPVMRCVGGDYIELGVDSLNPLGLGAHLAPDDAASLVLPVLAVMAGDERGVSGGRVVRRLPDEDQGWLHECLVDFFRRAGDRALTPLLRDLVAWLTVHRQSPSLTDTERERVRVVAARLRRYTVGTRAAVFDRPSSFVLGGRPVAIGMKRFAMAYGADLTPALAVVLTHLLAAIQQPRHQPLVVVVDEAHRVTSDPDAGEVLGQLVRQARKHGCGVWMATQRVEDFVGTDLGRTLAATAATKLVLGTEEAVAGDVRAAFQLSDAEMAAICPMRRGTGVLIAGAERAVVEVVPGPALLAVSSTSPVAAGMA